MRFAFTLAFALAYVSTSFSQSKPPNVVMIVSDDQGWGDYSFMGHPQIKTPHLDKLASQSLVYRRGYVPSSLCCPSLASLLTGKYPHQTKITGNEPPAPEGKGMAQRYKDPTFLAQVNRLNGFMAEHPRIPAELGKAGYQSFQTGKWWAGNFKTGGFTHGMSHGDQAIGGRHGDEGLKIGRQGMKPIFDFMDNAGNNPFFIWYAPENVFIGTTKLDSISLETRSACSGIMIGEKTYHGRGLAIAVYKILLGYAFINCDLNRISDGCNENNIPAYKTYCRLGFKLEGTFRQADCIDGKFSNHFHFGILREEFLAKNKIDLGTMISDVRFNP